MLRLQLSQSTWLHRVPAWLKLLVLAAASMALFSVHRLEPLIAALVACIVLYLSCGANAAKIGFTLLKPILWLSLILILYHLAFDDVYAGLVIALRFIVLIALANLMTMTTSIQSMLTVFQWLMRPLSLFGINTDKIALAIAMVIRFTPVLVTNLSQLRLAWRARSTKPASWRIITPLFIETMDDASHISEAIRARGGI